MKYSTSNQATALAGVFQAAMLVHQLALKGQCDEMDLTTSIHSILVTSPKNVAEVYNYEKLHLGTPALKRMLSADSKQPPLDSNVIRYALALLHIERKLSRRSDMLSTIGQRLERTKDQSEHFGLLHDNVINSLAGIYLDTISTFRTRIQVNGQSEHLQNNRNAEKIRAVLLAGVRSAMLWRQCGGSRWQLFIRRSKLLEALK